MKVDLDAWHAFRDWFMIQYGMKEGDFLRLMRTELLCLLRAGVPNGTDANQGLVSPPIPLASVTESNKSNRRARGKEIQNEKVSTFLAANPKATALEVSAGTGVPQGTVRSLDAWKAQQKRNRGGNPPSKSVATKPTSVKTHEELVQGTISDGRNEPAPQPLDQLIEEDEEERAYNKEIMNYLIEEQAAEIEKAERDHKKWQSDGKPSYSGLRDKLPRNKPR